MAITITLGGEDYVIPSPGESDDWGDAFNAYLVALAAAVTAAAATRSPLAITFGFNQTENSTRFMQLGGPVWPTIGGEAATTDIFVPVPVAGAVTSFQIKLNISCPSSTGTIVFTVRKNGVDTTMVITLTCNGAGLAYRIDNTHTFSVAVGDLLSIKVLDAGLNAAVNNISAILCITPT